MSSISKTPDSDDERRLRDAEERLREAIEELQRRQRSRPDAAESGLEFSSALSSSLVDNLILRFSISK
ncbi:hypothetical protein LWI29_034732 [Acer saccharum]|uniref:Uncharacterized protein n=1 Tax=Acer saccharum TaxID=4024 RepID=A0AA39SE66_ACESA|nr:hypothetical protein LWI29_034732 [Acer saccharum]